MARPDGWDRLRCAVGRPRLSSGTEMRPRSVQRQPGIVGAVMRLAGTVPPGGGAVVMGVGIVSIDLHLAGAEALSRVLLGIAAAAWVLLGLLLTARLVGDRPRFAAEARLPASLTGVAGTAVLGTRLALLGWSGAGLVLLAVAGLLWPALLGGVLRHWVTPTVGVSFMATVSTESLAVLLAVLSLATRTGWAVVLAVVLLAMGTGIYATVVARFDLHQLVRGRGDHWVAGGALAICALACGTVTLAARDLHLLGGGAALRGATAALWVAAVAWLPLLVATELVSRRVLYDTRRWATVFPVGMYAACSFVAGSAIGWRGLIDFARVWSWVALAVSAVVLLAMLWQPIPLLRTGSARSPRTAGEPADS